MNFLGEVDVQLISQNLKELRSRIDSFRKKVDLRTELLFYAVQFFLHYNEIMTWYAKMDQRSITISVIPDSYGESENNKEKYQSENDGTNEARAQVHTDTVQLLQALDKQSTALNVDNSEAVRHIEHLRSNVGRNFLKRKL